MCQNGSQFRSWKNHDLPWDWFLLEAAICAVAKQNACRGNLGSHGVRGCSPSYVYGIRRPRADACLGGVAAKGCGPLHQHKVVLVDRSASCGGNSTKACIGSWTSYNSCLVQQPSTRPHRPPEQPVPRPPRRHGIAVLESHANSTHIAQIHT